MRHSDTLNVYSKLREAFEEKEAKIIAVAIENAFEEADEALLKEVATKEDIAKIRTEDLAKLKAEFKEDIAIVEAKIGVLEANLKAYIANFKTEIIKWMFLFWIGQTTVIGGLVFSIVKFVK